MSARTIFICEAAQQILQELAERKLWDATLMDGLDPDERWTEDGRCLNPDQE